MIYDLNADFPFAKVKCLRPVMTHGSFTIKYQIDEYPLYVKFPTCSLKKKIEHAVNKKTSCDLMFSGAVPYLADWMEKLEEVSQQQMKEHNKVWFADLDESDIEGCFVQTLKLYKSGRFYLLKASIPEGLPVYDESGENRLTLADLTEEMEFGTVLEFKGIRCATKSFQIEVEVKQIRLRKVISFDTCIIRDLYSSSKPLEETSEPTIAEQPITAPEPIAEQPITAPEPIAEQPITTQEPVAEQPITTPEPIEEQPITTPEPIEEHPITEPEPVDLAELNATSEDTVNLMSRAEARKKMYKEARDKAKRLKGLALSAYLNAQRIKNELMIDDADESDVE
jgi:hypothetical protein